MVERVGRSYGYQDTTVVMEAQLAMIKLEPDEHMTFVKGWHPRLPAYGHVRVHSRPAVEGPNGSGKSLTRALTIGPPTTWVCASAIAC